jgi:hypothetical protein
MDQNLQNYKERVFKKFKVPSTVSPMSPMERTVSPVEIITAYQLFVNANAGNMKMAANTWINMTEDDKKLWRDEADKLNGE